MNLLVKGRNKVRRLGKDKLESGQGVPTIIRRRTSFATAPANKVVYYSDRGVRCSKCGKLY